MRPSLRVRKRDGRISARGRLQPAHPGHRMNVILFKRKNGQFDKLAERNPLMDLDGRYATSFDRPGAGRCRVTARFLGDSDHLPNKVVKTFDC